MPGVRFASRAISGCLELSMITAPPLSAVMPAYSGERRATYSSTSFASRPVGRVSSWGIPWVRVTRRLRTLARSASTWSQPPKARLPTPVQNGHSRNGTPQPQDRLRRTP